MFYTTLLLGITMGFMIGLALFGWQYTKQAVSKSRIITTETILKATREKLDNVQQENIQHIERASALEVHNENLTQKLLAQDTKAKEMEGLLLLRFEELSNKILDKKSEKFSQQNKMQIESLLVPLKERITNFQRDIVDTKHVSIQGQKALKTEFEKINDLYRKIKEETSKATEAILGNNKTQGTWGEAHAIQILENTGLREGEQFFLQKSFTTQEGKRYIPDIIIKLPHNRSIVMDVKVSLLHYMKYHNAKEPKEKALYLKKHLQSIKTHIKTLSQKNYAQIYQLDGLDFVLLLLPVEPAFSLAIQEEPSLFEEAYQHNIVLVSPTTLRATLSIIEHIWRNNAQNQNALEIAQRSGALYDKFVGFLEDIKKIGTQLDLSQKSYENALKKLSTGKGNLINRATMLKKLGARTSKVLDVSTLPARQEE